eukprot:1160081-Pelagomonas_calceolata.AAC.3
MEGSCMSAFEHSKTRLSPAYMLRRGPVQDGQFKSFGEAHSLHHAPANQQGLHFRKQGKQGSHFANTSESLLLLCASSL